MGINDEFQRKVERARLLEKKIELQDGLPFLYGVKLYKWQREFLNTTNKNLYLTAANQIGKSTIQWIKLLTWLYHPELWSKLWPKEKKPLTAWYLYPTKDVATQEFQQKIEPLLMPRGKFANDPRWGWKAEYKNGILQAIHLNLGPSIIIKSYATDVKNLQTGTAWYVACDEELPWDLYGEINARRTATGPGFFSMVFTATSGQQEWFQVMERIGEKDERFPKAHKMRASLFDCEFFEDGTPSHLTKDVRQQMINACGSDAEYQRRIMGRFVKETGRRVQAFSRQQNVRPATPVPPTWLWYVGVDPGSSGETGHPAAICFVAVNPELTAGRVVKCWRGDETANTTPDDVYKKYKEMAADTPMTGRYYDWACKDFEVFASRDGCYFEKAEKSHELGFPLMNSLFKNVLVTIDDTVENQPLIEELEHLMVGTRKQSAKDDQIDSFRYAITKIPWDLSVITSQETLPALVSDRVYTTDELRMMPIEAVDKWEMQAEIDEWNDLYEP